MTAIQTKTGRRQPAKHDQHVSATGNYRKTLLWSGKLPVFSSLLEGGPGRPVTLLVLSLAGAGLLFYGISQTGGNGNAGPVMILFGLLIMLTLVFWLLVKAVLRNRDVEFLIDAKGVHIRPSSQQAKLDRRMRILMLIVFWLTLKGGQWATWAPSVRWKEIRSVRMHVDNHQVLITGGAWHIRLVCTPDNFPEVCELLHAWCPGNNVRWR